MLKLLNRIAWISCLALGFIIASHSISSYYMGEWFSFLFALTTGLIIKQCFLSRSFIELRLEHFAHTLLTRENTDISNTPVAEEQAKNDIVSPSVSNNRGANTENDSYNTSDEALLYPKEREEDTGNTSIKTSSGYIKKFFSENILAKIGGILVFLGVIFLLSLVWNQIPGIIQLLMGFIIGIGVYISGVILEQKGLKNEGRILLGVGILINYAVILAGRHIMGATEIETSPFLGTGITFFFLILNTIFAVVTSLYYQSNTLLIFSLFAAYLNPFLTGGESASPYILVAYSLIISIGALYIAKKEENIFISSFAYFFGILLMFVAPGNAFFHWLMKFLGFNCLSLITLFSVVSFKKALKNNIEILFAATFTVIAFFQLLLPNNFSEPISHIYAYSLPLLSSIGCMFLAYMYARKWPALYMIGSLGSALLLGSLIKWDIANVLVINCIGIFLYALLNFFYPFLQTFKTTGENSSVKSFIMGSISGVLFLGFEWYNFSQGDFSNIGVGIGFFILAITYFILGYAFLQKTGIEKLKKELGAKNTLYNFLAISTSLFSLSIAYIFSESHEIVSTIWLFEASIIFYFYTQLKDIKVYIAGLLLLFFGITNLYTLVGELRLGEYFFFIPFTLISLSLFFNIKILNKEDKLFIRVTHDVLHLFGALSLAFFILQIVPHSGHGWSIFGISIFGVLISYVYSIYNSIILKHSFLIFTVSLMCYHIITLSSILHIIDNDHLSYLRLLQYITTAIISFSAYLFYTINKHITLKMASVILLIAYLFIISTLYIYDIFSNIFSLTLYWGVLAFLLIHTGISKNIIRYRTLGLYLIALMCLKIFFIDIWGISDPLIKIGAFIAVGIMLITISTMYSKKYGNNLKGEFQLSNLLDSSDHKKISSGTF